MLARATRREAPVAPGLALCAARLALGALEQQQATRLGPTLSPALTELGALLAALCSLDGGGLVRRALTPLLRAWTGPRRQQPPARACLCGAVQSFLQAVAALACRLPPAARLRLCRAWLALPALHSHAGPALSAAGAHHCHSALVAHFRPGSGQSSARDQPPREPGPASTPRRLSAGLGCALGQLAALWCATAGAGEGAGGDGVESGWAPLLLEACARELVNTTTCGGARSQPGQAG